MPLKLRNLTIELKTYGQNEGKYEGTISYVGQHGSTTLTLDPLISDRFLAVIGPVISEAALNVSKQLEESLAQSLLESTGKTLELTNTTEKG